MSRTSSTSTAPAAHALSAFTGTPFRSRPQRDLLVVAEGAVVSGTPDPAFFSVVVDVAAELPG